MAWSWFTWIRKFSWCVRSTRKNQTAYKNQSSPEEHVQWKWQQCGVTTLSNLSGWFGQWELGWGRRDHAYLTNKTCWFEWWGLVIGKRAALTSFQFCCEFPGLWDRNRGHGRKDPQLFFEVVGALLVGSIHQCQGVFFSGGGQSDFRLVGPVFCGDPGTVLLCMNGCLVNWDMSGQGCLSWGRLGSLHILHYHICIYEA